MLNFMVDKHLAIQALHWQRADRLVIVAEAELNPALP